MKIEFGKFGMSLGTRPFGEKIRNEIIQSFNNGEKVVLDFSGVSMVSNSFADEIIGKLIVQFGFTEFKNNTTFLSTCNEVQNVILKVINDALARIENN